METDISIQLDNSAFSLLSCDHRFNLRVVKGIEEPKGLPAAFGDAIHKGLEYQDHAMPMPAILAKLHSVVPASNIPKVMSTLTFFNLSFKQPPPILINNSPATEVKFRHLYGTFLVPNSHTKLNIYLVGTIDRIFLDPKDDILVIRDYKATEAATSYAIEKKLKSYGLAFQLPFYFYALLNFGILPACYLDYLTTRRYRLEIVLLCHNTAPPSFKTYQRQPFPDYYISHEIPMIIHNKIQQALAIASLTTPAAKTGFTVYQACDWCGFRPACLSTGTPKEEEILSSMPRSPYDPLSFR